MDASDSAIVIQFKANPPVDPGAIIAFMQSRKDTRLAGADKIRVEVETPDLKQRVQRIREIISAITRENDKIRQRAAAGKKQ